MDSKPDALGPVDTSVFTDAHFLAASRTFQDHLYSYSNWLSDAHAEKVGKYEEGIKDGTLAAPWKDEIWERNNTEETKMPSVSSTALAGYVYPIPLFFSY
jgi:hypothetical protein